MGAAFAPTNDRISLYEWPRPQGWGTGGEIGAVLIGPEREDNSSPRISAHLNFW